MNLNNLLDWNWISASDGNSFKFALFVSLVFFICCIPVIIYGTYQRRKEEKDALSTDSAHNSLEKTDIRKSEPLSERGENPCVIHKEENEGK